MTKEEIRLKYKKLRTLLSKEDIENQSIAIANQLLKMNIWNKTYYHIFLPIFENNEVNTENILPVLIAKEKEIVVSKTNFQTTTMQHILLTENTIIKKNRFNIPEPTTGIEVPINMINVVFVPLLAYDYLGNRVGYGKGFYDKFLADCNKDVLKIGLSFFKPESEKINTENTDIRLDYCVCPDGFSKFN